MLKYCLDRCKTQKICDKAVNSYLLTLQFVSNWFLTNRMIEQIDNALFCNDNIIFGDIGTDIATFFSNNISLNIINHNNVNLDNNNFDDCYPKTTYDYGPI